jgi:hypothetical protein
MCDPLALARGDTGELIREGNRADGP